jgi:di/tricarboxylate transporter
MDWFEPFRDSWQATFTLGTVIMVLVLLAIPSAMPDLVLIGAVVLLLAVGILSPQQALDGLSNEAMVTVAILYVVGAGVRDTGSIDWVASHILGRRGSERSAIARLTFPTAAMSAFINNTPLVAMLIPVVADWCKKHRLPASKLMIPISYAAILGGTCTLVGTSTNLVVDGLLKKHNGHALGMFDITWVGLPAALAGCGFMIFFASWLLPNRQPAISRLDDPRQYTTEMIVESDSPLVGKSIEQAGLRHLPNVYLAEIDREGMVLAAVSPEERLRAADRLVFVGIVDSVVELQKIRGLVPSTGPAPEGEAQRHARALVEAVVSDSCPLIGQSIREGRFRSHYNAAVLAVARNGDRLRQKIGDIVLRPGDTLLLEGPTSFAEEHRNRRDFFLVSRVDDDGPVNYRRAPVALVILIGMVMSVGLGYATMLKAGLFAAALMVLFRCCSIASARRSIDLETLLAIAASFALGKALETTKAAQAISDTMVGWAGNEPWLVLAMIYLVTLIVTELITNNAAAALMFPFAMSTAARLEVSYMPFVIVVMMAASAGFATPIGYQTNLMVYGPGGYKFSDYLKIGVPLDLLVFAMTVAVTPFVWPFT